MYTCVYTFIRVKGDENNWNNCFCGGAPVYVCMRVFTYVCVCMRVFMYVCVCMRVFM